MKHLGKQIELFEDVLPDTAPKGPVAQELQYGVRESGEAREDGDHVRKPV